MTGAKDFALSAIPADAGHGIQGSVIGFALQGPLQNVGRMGKIHATDDRVDKVGRVESRFAQVLATELFVVMTPIASSLKLAEHLGAIGQEASRLPSMHRWSSGRRGRLATVHALIA